MITAPPAALSDLTFKFSIKAVSYEQLGKRRHKNDRLFGWQNVSEVSK
jgi:hypothetical protein